MSTYDLYIEILESLNLGPAQRNELKSILSALEDGEEIDQDIDS